MKPWRSLTTLILTLLIASTAWHCSSTANGGVSQWAWLGENGGTYWYVPFQYLPAVEWSTDDPSAYSAIEDQTVWHIESYANGYFFGPIVAKLTDHPVSCQYLIGSVTPDGKIYITFNSIPTIPIPIGTPSLTTGLGSMVQQSGDWTFNMQMASGSSSSQVSHWAFMLQCTPDQPCWSNLPGSAQSIPDFLAQCE